MIYKEGLFLRREKLIVDIMNFWLYEEDDVIIVGENCKYLWKLYGMFGVFVIFYGVIGENYILVSGFGVKMVGGLWINMGEGGVILEYLYIGVNIVV